MESGEGGADGELECAVEIGGGGGLLDAVDGGAGGLQVVGRLGRGGVRIYRLFLIDGAGGGDDHRFPPPGAEFPPPVFQP